MKRAVDALGTAGAAPALALAAATKAVLCFGGCVALQSMAKELQHPTFTPISQVGPCAPWQPSNLIVDCSNCMSIAALFG